MNINERRKRLENVVLKSLAVFVALTGLNVLMAFAGYKLYPNRRPMVKKYLIYVGIMSVLIGSIMVYMFYQFSKLGL